MTAFLEVPLLQGRVAGHRTLSVVRAAGSDPLASWFSPARFGGGRALASSQPGETRLLRWSCSDSAGCVLDVNEISLNADLKGASVTFLFPAPLSSSVCVVDSEAKEFQGLLLFALTADGVVHRVRLLQTRSCGPHDSVLSELSLKDVVSLDVTAELRRLDRFAFPDLSESRQDCPHRCINNDNIGLERVVPIYQSRKLCWSWGNCGLIHVCRRPTCMTAFDTTVCIGGSNGRVTVLNGKKPFPC
jgi:hypothetical protein